MNLNICLQFGHNLTALFKEKKEMKSKGVVQVNLFMHKIEKIGHGLIKLAARQSLYPIVWSVGHIKSS